MGYTNKTTHYELPQYVATDKPKYLTDFNETMQAIDTQMYTNAQAAATADGKAVAAKETADGAVSSIGTLNAQINGDPLDPADTGLAGDVSDLGTDVNTIQSLIGNGTPTTSDQTIIGAVNGLEGAIAPREDGTNLANSYTTGEQFARGGSIYTALTDLTADTAFASLTLNTDYKVSDTLVEQIADIPTEDSRITNKYVISEEVWLSVTGDGVKTIGDLLGELLTAFVTRLQAMPDNDFCEIKYLAIPNLHNLIEQDGKRFTNATTATMYAYFTNITCGSSNLDVHYVEFKSTPVWRRTRIEGTPTVTISDQISTVVADGATVAIDGFIYHKVV